MDDVSSDGVNAAKAARRAEGCRRHKAISRLVDYGKQPLPRSEPSVLMAKSLRHVLQVSEGWSTGSSRRL